MLRRTIPLAIHTQRRIRNLAIHNGRPVAGRFSRHVPMVFGSETLSRSGKMFVVSTGGSRERGAGDPPSPPPLIFGKKRRITEGRNAGMAS